MTGKHEAGRLYDLQLFDIVSFGRYEEKQRQQSLGHDAIPWFAPRSTRPYTVKHFDQPTRRVVAIRKREGGFKVLLEDLLRSRRPAYYFYMSIQDTQQSNAIDTSCVV